MSRLENKKRNIYKKTIGIKDIAKFADVSVATVSRALRRDPATKSTTAEKIIKIARKLDYFPDSLAKGLREKRTNTIGVIFNDINNPFYADILSSIHGILTKDGYSMIVSYSNWDFEQERNNIRTMLSKRVDGIIISPLDYKSKNINLLIQNNLPSVLVDCHPYFKQVNYVYTDHKKSSVLSTNHLIKNGHKNILIIIMPYDNFENELFLKGYLETLSENGIKPIDKLIVQAKDLSIESGNRTFTNIIKNNLKSNNKLNFTAVITISDLLAAGIFKAANELGLKIPEDYSIVGYDNIELASALVPPLTTIHQPRKRIGRESTKILLNQIKSEGKSSFIQKLFDPEIIIRKSVKKIN